MSVQKPTAEELKQWEDQLQDEGLSMTRGYNGHKLNYGFEDGNSLVRTWDDVKVYTRQKRKETTRLCMGCALIFAGRADALCCSARCRKRLERLSHITNHHSVGAN